MSTPSEGSEPTLDDLCDFLSGNLTDERRKQLDVQNPNSPIRKMWEANRRMIQTSGVTAMLDGSEAVERHRKEHRPVDFQDAIRQVEGDDLLQESIKKTLRQAGNED